MPKIGVVVFVLRLWRFLKKEMFGVVPPIEKKATAELGTKVTDFLDGKALLQEVSISLLGDEKGPKLNLLIVTPTAAKG
ncbi:hypothetical protein N9965_01280, partial [bacterium]|nr:hypothetical protein [bacterium]